VSLHGVRCGDYGDPDEEWIVEGFPGAEAAADYARRFIRAQIEDLRAETGSAEELRQMYFRFGEYAFAAGLDHDAWVAHCIAVPASRKAEVDYAALEPRAGRGRRA
jgi:hypothetical protein